MPPTPNIRETFALLRALRNLRVATAEGEVPLLVSGRNAILDLRAITAAGTAAAVSIPTAPAAGYVLFSDSTAADGVRWVDLGTELSTWVSRVQAAGGTFTTTSIAIAARLLRQIRASSFSDKLVYLLPLLGGNLAAARVPLRDTLAVGIAGNINFVDADFSEATGLQGDGTSKQLSLIFTPGQLGVSSSGGLGYWELAASVSGTTVTAMGCLSAPTDDQAYRIIPRLDSPARNRFDWGTDANNATASATGHNGNFYGQRSSSTSRVLYHDGASVGSNVTADAASKAGSAAVRLMGDNGGPLTNGSVPRYYAGRCGVAYATDGTLTADEVAELHTILDTYLITPTGR